jgi:virginiamycin B lyase
MSRGKAAAMLGVGLLLTAAAPGNVGDTAATPTATPSTTTATPSLPEIQDIEVAGALVISTSGNADWVTVAGDSAWVASVGTGIIRYDLTTGDMLDEILIPGNDICLAMDEGFGSLWAVDCVDNTLVRIDVVTGVLDHTIDLPFAIRGESSVAVGEDGVWMLSDGTQPELVRIDPTTNAVADTLSAPSGATAVRAGDGSLWITRAGTGQLIRVDPGTGEELAVIDVAPGSIFLAYGEGGVWTMGSTTGDVVHVDPATNSVVATIPTGGRVEGGDIAVGGGYVWARISDALIAQIDPATDTVIARYGPATSSGSADADDQAVWVSDFLAQTVWRLPLD